MRYKILLFIMLTVSFSVFAQRHGGDRMGRNRDKIEQLEKVKLIEILDMDEETTLKFFARRNNFKDNSEQNIEKREKLLQHLEQMIIENEIDDESIYKDEIDKILDIEKALANKRINFISSLDDLLTSEQIAKYVVFEFKFRREIRDILFKHRRFPERD